MLEIPHLSYSSISNYQLCAKSWCYKYVEKIPTITSPSLALGSAFHNTLEALIRARVKGESLSAYETWGQCWAKATEQAIAWNGQLPEELSSEGLRLLGCADAQQVIDSINPLVENGEPVIEKRIELHVPDVPIPIIGYIDLITADGVVCDFKTSAKSWTTDKAQSESQPLFYLAALNQAGIKTDYRVRHYVFVKTRKPQVQVIETKRTISELFGLIRTIRDVWRGIEAEAFPMNTASWKCSSKWCDYFAMCREG